ncbi:MAG TPA: HAD family hydrolase [Candidatus Dormibacteraeota bacterium]|nr:HAD family hydrolase [Candidatus Dormibacteraeota bacterium]
MEGKQTLIIDGDDTLWENNIYFEQAIEDFIDFLNHSRLSRSQVRAVLDEVEHLNTRVHGYGSAAFARNLQDTFERLAERDLQPGDLDHIMGLARRIVREELELLPGVPQTLDVLKDRHRLLLFTKGELEEQRLKVERSRLADRFGRVTVAREKNVASYRELLHDNAVDPRSAWMIGNSPRSDILPALEVGLGAVYIPHAHTWSLERAAVPAEHPRLIVLRAFAELTEHF